MTAASERPLALVTGASSGIGEAFARALAARGYDVALVARRADRLEALAAELIAAHQIKAFALPADLSELGAAERVLAAVAARGRSVDCLVNNAGLSIAQSFDAVPWKQQQDFLMILIVNACGLAHGVLAEMKARGSGRIINVGSLAGFAPGVAGHSLYPGAKSLMTSFSQSLDAENRRHGVKVTVVCPGFTKTEFAAANGTAEIMDQAPRRLFQTPEQVVAAALRANDRGKVVEVPGWHNKVAALALQYLPRWLMRAALMQGSARYHLKDPAP